MRHCTRAHPDWPRKAQTSICLLGLIAACRTNSSPAGVISEAKQHYELGLAKVRIGEVEDAIDEFDEALEIDPANFDAVRARVDAVRRLGHLEELIRDLEKRSSEDPNDPVIHYSLGIALFASSAAQLEPALASLKRATELSPHVAEFWLRTGIALLEAERFTEARPLLEHAIALEPSRARGYLPLGIVLYRLGDRRGSLATLAKVLDYDPDPRDVQDAARIIERMYDPFRDFPASLGQDLEEAIVWAEKADLPRQALDKIEPILEKFPDQAILHSLAGLCYERLDDSGRAVEAFRRAIELTPEDPRPRQYLGDLYHSKERFDAATEQYMDVLKSNPFSEIAHRRIGEYGLLRGDAKTAIDHLRIVTLLSPRSMTNHIALAKAFGLAGQLEGATKELSWVTERDDSNLDAWISLGNILLQRSSQSKNPVERHALAVRAAAAFEKVLDKQPENAAAARALARAKAE